VTVLVDPPSVPSEAPAKRQALALQLARHFRSGGYEVERDAAVVGSSGELQDVDLLAFRAYGASTVVVMVDCDAWNRPIDRDAVIRARLVASDLGVDRAVVVSLVGCRVDAEHAARQAGIDLWYTFELERRLGGPIRVGASEPRPELGPDARRRTLRRLRREPLADPARFSHPTDR
jgi:hypothetical protein